MNRTVSFLESLLFVALFMTGLAALSFHLLRDDGWLERTFGTTWDLTVRYPLIAVPLIIGALVAGKLWRDDRVAHGKHDNRVASIVLYLIAGVGVYYAAHYAIHGSF